MEQALLCYDLVGQYILSYSMHAKTVTKIVLTLAVLTLLSLLVFQRGQEFKPLRERVLLSYETSSLRTNNVNSFCPANVDRTNLVPKTQIFTAETLRNNLNQQLGIDGNKLLNQLFSGNLQGFKSTLMKGMVNLVFYIAVFLLPFLVFIVIWPILCCCCTCPFSCPPQKCRKEDTELYTMCELFWPAATLLLAHALIIVFAIYGFSTTSTVSPLFRNVGCTLAIFTDDLLNGNVTIPKTSFFTGLNLFAGNLGYLGGNLTNIQNNLTDLADLTSGVTYTQVDNVKNALTTIKNIPDGLGLTSMTLTYDTPISSGFATGSLSSSFNSILGSWSTPSSLTSNLYLSVESARALMNSIKVSANAFTGQVSNIQASITPMNTSLHAMIDDVVKLDDKLASLLSILDIPAKYANLIMQCFYGVLIGLSVLGVVGVLFTVLFRRIGCRHVMYTSCIGLFIIGWVAFIIAVVFSVLVPLLTWTCSFLDVAVGSLTGFQDNFGPLLTNATASQISVCMPFGDGVIVNTIGGGAREGLNNLTYVIESMASYNNTLLKTAISTNLQKLVSTTNSYANGDISDLDSANNAILAGFSNPNNSTNNALCNASFVDSWVPSNNQNAAYSSAVYCQSQSANVGSYSTCDVNLAPASTCKGCMDTTQILTRHSNAAAVVSAVKGKYGANCAFATLLGNAWTNYFSKKYATLGFPTAVTQVAGTVMHRVKQAQDIVNVSANSASVFANIDAFKASLNTISANMNSISTLTDPNYGMLAGLNCKLFGQDFLILQNIFCVSFYNNVYNVRIIFGICAWGILFVLCCSVCTGVRHFNQFNQSVKVAPVQQEATVRTVLQDAPSKHAFVKEREQFD